MTYISWSSDFLLNITKTILWIYIILGIFDQNDTMNELIVLLGQYDLYFMVQ